MTEFKYKITEAAIQLGAEPPYNLINASVRMEQGVPQVKVDGKWYDYPKDGHRELPIKRLYGQPVAGIASTWELDRD